MKNIAICILLAACSPPGYQQPEPPDAPVLPDSGSRPSLDASTPDGSILPSPTGRCDMGLLPGARTKTYVDSDAIDPQILDELQDQIIGAKRPGFARPQAMPFTVSGGVWAAPVIVTDGGGVPRIASASTGNGSGYINLPFHEGDRIVSLTARVCGNGVADVSFDVSFSTVATGLTG